MSTSETIQEDIEGLQLIVSSDEDRGPRTSVRRIRVVVRPHPGGPYQPYRALAIHDKATIVPYGRGFPPDRAGRPPADRVREVATGRISGAEVRQPFYSAIRWERGRVVWQLVTWSFDEALRAAGLPPQPEAADSA